MTPEQCRAGRALLNWSQDELEAKSGVSKKTIADFERGAQIAYPRTQKEIEFALEAAGVELIPENGGGAGVRLKAAIPRLARRRVSRFDREALMVMTLRDREYRVRFTSDILDDIDRANYGTDDEFEKAFDRHVNMILVRAAIAIDRDRADVQGNIRLTSDDFPETR